MELLTALKQAGLRDKEARLYLALLKLGSASVTDIARDARIKRPTAYVLLEKLEELGFVTEVSSQGRERMYVAAKPQTILDRLEQRVMSFEKSLPALEELVSTQAGRPNVQIFEGLDGVRTLYEYIFSQPGEHLFFTDTSTMNEVLGTEFLVEVNNRFRREKKRYRELVSNTAQDRKYARDAAADQPHRQVRVLQSAFNGDLDIVGDSVVLVSYEKDNYYSVMITSPIIAQGQRLLFEEIWRKARRVT